MVSSQLIPTQSADDMSMDHDLTAEANTSIRTLSSAHCEDPSYDVDSALSN